MTDFVFVGGGAWAREIHGWFADDFARDGHKVVGFLQSGGITDANANLPLPYLGSVAPESVPAGAELIMAVATPNVKGELANRFPDKTRFATLKHSRALVSASARIGRGVVLSPMSVVSANAEVADFVTVNVFGGVGHDVVVGTGSTLSSYVDLTGGVTVGDQSFWGSGARALPGVQVGARTVIGAGSVVVRNVPDDATVYAMPARRLRTDP